MPFPDAVVSPFRDHRVRVLMIAQFYPPIAGGEEHAVAMLAAELARRGHHVAVATIHHPGMPEREEVDGVAVHRLRSSASALRVLYSADRLHAPPGPDPSLVRQLRRVLEIERPDIVHAHNWMVHSYLPIKRGSGAPLILSLHDYSLVCSTKRLMREGVPCEGPGIGKCLRCAGRQYGRVKGAAIASMVAASAWPEAALVDAYVAVSRTVAERNGLHRRSTPHEVIPNFFSAPTAARSLSVPALPAGGFILYAGDVSREKGADVLLRAYAGIESPVMPLVMIGRQLLEADEPGDGNRVIRIDRLDHASVVEAFRRCAIAVVPSVWPEPFGLVALEAMAMGRPVIASRAGGLPDIVADGESGLLVRPGDEEDLRQALALLMADGGLRARLGAAGLRRLEQYFSAGVVVPRFERLYERAISRWLSRSGGTSRQS